MTHSQQQQKQQKQNKNQKISKIQKQNKIMLKGNFISTSAKVSSREPITSSTKDGMRVKHREFIGQVAGTTTSYAVKANYAINPGNANMFPWLSGLASRFDKFRVHNLVFEYRHQVSTTVGGTVGAYVDYDPVDAPAGTLSDAANVYRAEMAAPYDDFSVRFNNRENSMKSYFMTTQSPSAVSEPQTHFPGQIIVFASGNPSSTDNIGNVWVDYDIELLLPQMTGSTFYAPNGAGMFSFGLIKGSTGFYQLKDFVDGILNNTASTWALKDYYNQGLAISDYVNIGSINKNIPYVSMMTKEEVVAKFPSTVTLQHKDAFVFDSTKAIRADLTYVYDRFTEDPPTVNFYTDNILNEAVDAKIEATTQGGFNYWTITVTFLVIGASTNIGLSYLAWAIHFANDSFRICSGVTGMVMMQVGEALFLSANSHFDDYLPFLPRKRIEVDHTQKFKQEAFDHASVAAYGRVNNDTDYPRVGTLQTTTKPVTPRY